MKAEIDRYGGLIISAETIPEAFALQYIFPISEVCPECNQMKPLMPLVIDYSVLNADGGEGGE